MAANQTELHRIGRLGQNLAKKNGIAKGRAMSHNHTFDFVDTLHHTADEVKTRTFNGENGRSIKIGISGKSFKRKLDYAQKHNLKARLVLVLIDEDENLVASYTGELRQHTRPSGLKRIRVRRKRQEVQDNGSL